MHNTFTTLIEELSLELDVELEPDIHDRCALVYNNTVALQIDYDKYKDEILIGSFVCDTPPGRFRESIFTYALKANNNFSRAGIFAYNEPSNQLVYYSYLSLEHLTGKKLCAHLGIFIQVVELWQKSVEQGNLFALEDPDAISTTKKPFGLL